MQTQSTHFEKRGDDMNTKREFWQRNAMAVIGMLIFSAGINLFIVPANLYNGGVLGISQVLRTVLVRYFHVASGTTDIAGIINMLLNIPLFALAYVFVGKKFFFRTLVCVISQTLFLSLIPIPAIPIVQDSLTASIIGGIFGGTGIGIALQSGGSSGGLDIVQGIQCRQSVLVGKCGYLHHLCGVIRTPYRGVQHYLFGSEYVDD